MVCSLEERKHDLVLSYFGVRALGQMPRYVMHAGNLKYQFDPSVAANWETQKAKMPFGQLPVLNVKGLGVIAQSSAITQYVATLAGFMPSDPFLRSRVLMVFEHFRDIRSKLGKAKYAGESAWGDVGGARRFIADKKAQEKAYEELRSTTLPLFLGNLEKLFPEDGFFLGKLFGPSLADIAAFATLQMLTEIGEGGVFKSFPKLRAIHANVREMGTLKEFLENDTGKIYYQHGDHA